MTTSHLSPEDLAAFANGLLEGARHDSAEAHVLECRQCCDALRSIDVAVELIAPALIQPRPNNVQPDSGSNSSSGHGRFLPGQIIGNRYRVVSLLGVGGMGEVYRADDLRLQQPVALKFLGISLAGNANAMERLHAEVSIARDIAHPNVCRVYDIGEVNDLPFLSMEYIDGEDLQTLLQRIGRLPRDKGIELSRQLCLGLNAAHRKGILHRDLKPANIMIDGRGQLRITDFGLATLADQRVTDVAGTPAYMAPEQISRGENTIQSDIYSLGLVLAEMFTGKRVVRGSTLTQVKRVHENSTPLTLSHDIAPEMEHIVRQCLAKQPSARPSSVAEVLSAMPTADPLSQVIASGETPSPELLASKLAEVDAIHPTKAAGFLATLFLGLAFLLFAPLGTLGGLIHTVDYPLEPAILAHKARSIVTATGYFRDQEPTWPSEAHGFLTNLRFGETATEESPLRPQDAYHYWYRTHHRPMVAERRLATRVSFDDPAPFWPGMVVLRLDLHGRLIDFHATPYTRQITGHHEFDFAAFFSKEVTGFDFSNFEPTDDTWTPQTAFDRLETWKQRGVPEAEAMRIFAATYRGRLIACRIMWPTDETPIGNIRQPIEDITRVAIVLLILLGCILARHNVRRGRSDRLGAVRIAWWSGGLTLIGWLFSASITGYVAWDSKTLVSGMQGAVFTGTIMWCFYLALEPFVRRFWPTTLITWTRLLRGQFQDQELGRDILVGLSAGAFCHVMTKLWFLAADAFGVSPRPSIGATPEVLLGMRESLAGLVECGLFAVTDSMFLLMFLFAIRLPIRVKGIATVLFVLFFSVLFSLLSPEYAAIHVLFWGTAAILMTRYGIVALVCFQFLRHAAEEFPLPADFSKWYAGYALIPLTVTALLGLYAYYIAVRPRRSTLGDQLGDQ